MLAVMSETSAKLNLLRQLADRHDLQAILLQRVSSFAWATGGAAAYVNTARSTAEASLLVTADEQYLLTDNIEAPRLEKEAGLPAQGWKFCVSPWFDKDRVMNELTKGMKLGSDESCQGAVDLSAEIARLRAGLCPEEGERFRLLGCLCAQAMEAAAHAVRPGMTEYEIAGLLAAEAEQRGVQATVNLIAVDERIFTYRHPLPTDNKLKHYAMLVLCGRRWGLVCSLTRLLYFGKLSQEIRAKAEAVARVDATMIAHTRPGTSLGQVIARTQEMYAVVGYADEWRLHHQGGPAGYEPREYLAVPGSTDVIAAGQVYAWNPSITGCKSEDSILVGKDGCEVLTSIEGWPMLKVEVAGQVMGRPDILRID